MKFIIERASNPYNRGERGRPVQDAYPVDVIIQKSSYNQLMRCNEWYTQDSKLYVIEIDSIKDLMDLSVAEGNLIVSASPWNASPGYANSDGPIGFPARAETEDLQSMGSIIIYDDHVE